MTKTFCDRCEKEIKEVIKAATIRFISSGNPYACLWDEMPKKQLCQPCFTALESFLNNK